MGRLMGIAGRPASGAPMVLAERCDISTDRGVDGDARGRPSPRQVTVLSQEAWAAAGDELGVALDWVARRANLLIEGVNLQRSAGNHLHVGESVLEITLEMEPCRIMDRAHRGLRAALQRDWRGGVCCRVIRGASVRIGDPVSLVENVRTS